MDPWLSASRAPAVRAGGGAALASPSAWTSLPCVALSQDTLAHHEQPGTRTTGGTATRSSRSICLGHRHTLPDPNVHKPLGAAMHTTRCRPRWCELNCVALPSCSMWVSKKQRVSGVASQAGSFAVSNMPSLGRRWRNTTQRDISHQVESCTSLSSTRRPQGST